jgi:type IV secretory pathway VirB10-like protein
MQQTIQQNTISDKAPKPSGLVPKNLQAFVLVGLALVMVLIMAVTGHKTPAVPAAQTPSAIPAPLPLNTEKVSEFEKRIEDAQRSSAPQAEAALLRQQKQLAAEGTLPAQPLPSSPYGTPVTSSSATGAYPPGAYASALPQPAQDQPQTESFREEDKKRRYMSLFSDNVALTYRKDAVPASATSPAPSAPSAVEVVPQDPLASQALAELARQSHLLAQVQRTAAAPQPAEAGSMLSPAPNAHSTSAMPQGAGTHDSSANTKSLASESISDGSRHVLFEGTILETVLINRLDGSFSGPVECLISNDVYSHDRQHVLIPAGSKVLGEAAKVDSFGQARLAVTFHRLVMPDGYSVSLDQFHSSVLGLDQQGATALKDKVNNHYAKIFGASLALGVLGGVSQAGTGTVLNSTAEDRMRQGFGAGLANAGDQILDRFLNILPTITIREGTRVKIYLSADLLLPDYHDHHLPPSL